METDVATELDMNLMQFDYMNALRITLILAVQAIALYFGVYYARSYYQTYFGNMKKGGMAEDADNNKAENLLKYDGEHNNQGYKQL